MQHWIYADRTNASGLPFSGSFPLLDTCKRLLECILYNVSDLTRNRWSWNVQIGPYIVTRKWFGLDRGILGPGNLKQ